MEFSKLQAELRAGKIVGKLIRFDYPAANYRGIRPRLEKRTLFVEKVRLIEQQPLDEITLHDDPMLRRGTALLTGQDVDKGAERSFYFESMSDIQQIEPDQLKLIPLRVNITDTKTGTTIRRIDLPDPRLSFCEKYNDQPPPNLIALPGGSPGVCVTT